MGRVDWGALVWIVTWIGREVRIGIPRLSPERVLSSWHFTAFVSLVHAFDEDHVSFCVSTDVQGTVHIGAEICS